MLSTSDLVYSIHQPNFLPWMGYFNKALKSDVVILFDSVQISTGKTWTSRTKILLNGSEFWLSIPVKKSGRAGQKICEVEMQDFQLHWYKMLQTIRQAYLKAPYFKEIFPFLESFAETNYQLLADFNCDFIQKTTALLSPAHPIFVRSSSNERLMKSDLLQTDYIVETCLAFGVKNYLAGKGGSLSFLELEKFAEAGIQITFLDFKHPVYTQLKSPLFQPGISIVDVLMNVGTDVFKR